MKKWYSPLEQKIVTVKVEEWGKVICHLYDTGWYKHSYHKTTANKNSDRSCEGHNESNHHNHYLDKWIERSEWISFDSLSSPVMLDCQCADILHSVSELF